MRVLVALVALCLIAVPVAAQQQEEPATLKMDGSPALADPGAPVALGVLFNFPEEYAGSRFVENVRIESASRLRRGTESLYDIRIREIATGTGNRQFRMAKVPFISADEAIGRYLIERNQVVAELAARLFFRVELFSFESFRDGRWSPEKPFYCANVYRIEWTDKAGKTVATVP